ncbi:hypothetical protein CLAIMM_10564 [Cladophialophora immunda]|nr:hypothetical protein CLAIMM_10564 [Cladophialophora immunda]
MPDTSAGALLASLNHVPRPEVQEYVRAMYTERPDTVMLLVGWHGPDPYFCLYVPIPVLQGVSGILGSDGPPPSTGPQTVSPYTLHFRHQDAQAAVVFALWLGLHQTSDPAVYEAFDGVLRSKFEGVRGLFADCWEIADQFESPPFMNYLTTTMVKVAGDDFEVLIAEADRFAHLSYTGATIVSAMIENLAWVFVEHDLGLRQMLREWMRHPGLMNGSPPLLLDFLAAVEDMTGLKDRGLPYHPLDRLCWKWHLHRSMEERQACPDFDATIDTVLYANVDEYDDPSGGDEDDHGGDGGDDGDDGDDDEKEAEHGDPNPRSKSSHTNTRPEYHPGWAQERMEGRRTRASRRPKRKAESAGLDDGDDGDTE